MHSSPYAAALAALARRDYSAHEIDETLRRQGFDEEAIAEAIERLTADGYLDDGRFAAAFARTYRVRRKSDLYIRFKLKARGISAGIIDETLALLREEDGEEVAVREIVKRKYPAIADGTAPRGLIGKAYKYLTNAGFRIDVVAKILNGWDHDEGQ